jgi:uncharacterized membrane protein YkvA (DUF1232 family)
MNEGHRKTTEETIDAMVDSIKPGQEEQVIRDIPQKMEKLEHSKSNTIRELLDNIRIAFSMLRDSEYSLSWKTKTLLLAGLIYFLLPTDLTPDFIPLIGYIDDAAVMTSIFKRIAHEVKHYKLMRKI